MTYYKCGSVYTTQNSNVVVDTASGSVANFETDLALPIKSLEIDVNAKQDLHGYDYPWVAGGGKNLCPPMVGWSANGLTTTVDSDGKITVSGTATGTGGYLTSLVDLARVIPSGTAFSMSVTSSPPSNLRTFFDEGVADISVGTTKANNIIRNIDITKARLYLFTTAGQSYNFSFYFQIEIGSSATSYAPYENICPISGWSEISGCQLGKNLFNVNELALVDVGTTTGDRYGVYLHKSGTFTVSGVYNGSVEAYIYARKKLVDGSFSPTYTVQTGAASTSSPKTVTVNEGETLILYNASANQTEALSKEKMSNFQIELGSTATEYEPYNGDTEVINLGGTYYGGRFTQDKAGHRQFEVTHGIKLFGDISFSRSNNSGAWQSYLFYAQITDKTNGGVLKCSNYEYVVQATSTMQNEKIISVGSSKYIYVRDDAYTTVADFKTANANTQLVYPLATPIIIDLPDGEPIITLNGTNNIYADTGDCAVEFRKIG